MMSHRFLNLSLVACLFLALAGAHAQTAWTAPTADELTMKSDPKAPGAPAIVLSYEEIDDEASAEVFLHVRIKVLTIGGLEAGTIELPERIVSNDEFDRKIFARTIHSSGVMVDFKATPQNSRILDEDSGRPRRVISLPDVEVGSILEYTCHFAGQNTLTTYMRSAYSPTWHVQGRYYTRSAHFVLKVITGPEPDPTLWVAHLPAGVQPVRAKGRITLDMAEIPAVPDEDYMPPSTASTYGVRFFYYSGKRDKYWGTTGAEVDDEWADFTATSKPIVAAARQLAPSGIPEEQRIRHLYDAVQKLENTDLTRAHTAREDKHASRNSEEIWLRKRGDSNELTLLFVALTRAAGFKAYPMAVSSRDRAVFDQEVLSWSQMDSMLAIVELNGREIFFDPAAPLCVFGQIAPWHSGVMGVSTEAKLVKIRQTPTMSFNTIRTERQAELTLAADGSVTGSLKIYWLGNAGIRLRRIAMSQDKQAVETTLKEDFSRLLPDSLVLKVESIEHLDDGSVPLIATFSVSGTLGTGTAKRLIVPAQLFASRQEPTLLPETRVTPVAFPYPFIMVDRVIVHYPRELALEILPRRKTYNIGQNVAYDETVSAVQNTVTSQRTFVLSKVDYAAEAYTPLHKFFASVTEADQEPYVFAKQPAPAAQ